MKSHVKLFRTALENATLRLVRARQHSAWRMRRSGNDHVDMLRLRRTFPTDGSIDILRL